MAVFILLLAFPAAAQEKKYRVELSSGIHDSNPARGLKAFGRSALYASARFEKFLNNNYYQYAQEGYIERGTGFEISYSYIVLRPLALEVTGFYTSFDVSSLTDSGVNSVTHAGFEIYADAFVLPYIGKISNYVAPYVGIGYQTSSLKWGDNIAAGTGSAIFKAGTRIRIPFGIFFLFEYKQTLPKSSNKLFRTINIGAGYNF